MEAVTSNLMLEVVVTLLGAAFALVQGTKAYGKLKASRFAKLEDEAELAVHETAREFVEDLKRNSKDGKLTKDAIVQARLRARGKLQSYASNRGVDVVRELGYKSVDLLVEKAFARLKKAGVLMLALLCVGLSFGGCAITKVTNPDGSITETKTLEPWAQDLVRQGAPVVVAWITDELDDTPEPLTERERIELENNTALRLAMLGILQEQLAWGREHPGEAIPDSLKLRLDNAKARLKAEAASAETVSAPS